MEQRLTEGNLQAEVLKQFEEINRRWQNRIQAESEATSELASTLASARSVPDMLSAYQEWGKQRMQLMSEDVVQFYDNAQRLMQITPQLLLNGWRSDRLSS